MNRKLLLSLSSMLLASPVTLCQQPPSTTPRSVISDPVKTDAKASLTKFDLDFKGGTPGDLVRAIEKASGKPLNAIIPTELANTELPPLKMRQVNVAELFNALQGASVKRLQVVTGYNWGSGGMRNPMFSSYTSSYGFRSNGSPSDDAIWYFFYEKPPLLPISEEAKICRFYQLAPYLESYNIEDITTAVQTAWRMLGDAPPPDLNFHKDTKLLIAVGEASKLQLIDSVLEQLSAGRKTAAYPAPPVKSPEPAKP